IMTTITHGFLTYFEHSIKADYIVLPHIITLDEGNVGAGPGLATRLRATSGIVDVTTLRKSETRLGDKALRLMGIDPLSYPRLGGFVFPNGQPKDVFAKLDEGRYIIANGVLAEQEKLEIGHYVELETVDGIRRYRVAAIGTSYLNPKIAEAIMSHKNLAMDFRQSSDILLMARREANADRMVLEASLHRLVQDYPAFHLVSYEKWRAMQEEMFQLATFGMYVMLAFLVLPAALSLTNTLGINVLERTREIGMLRAIGAERRQIRRIVVMESVALCAMGIVGGLLSGLWMGYALVGAINATGTAMEYYFPWWGVLITVVVGVVFGLGAAVIPARHASRLNIIRALQYE
ncbi:MAG: ABC transporter permease, partial [bacterium]|nr:ABC transporter permease [bacterium]